MALSVNTGAFARAQSRLSNSQRAFKRRLLSDMTEMGKLMQRYARAMAPYETGSLENAIYYRLNRSDYSQVSITLLITGNRVRAQVGGQKRQVLVGDYADYMLHGHYNLGPGSIAKQEADRAAGSRVKVGPNFLSRAGELGWKKMRERLIESAHRAGFGQARGRKV